MSNLITRYRPQVLEDVIGQGAVVRSLQQTIKKQDAQVFLFSGPPGTGKTTLSRIVAFDYGVNPAQLVEIDAATFTGIDSMRDIQETLRYRPFGTSGKRAIILDEAHALSKQAFDSLLKTLEEPPEHVVWFFCTTNPAKIPKTLQTRCAKYELKPVNDKELLSLLEWVCEQEKIKLAEGVTDLLIKEAKGSPRELLSNLGVGRTAKNRKEAAELLKSAIETDASLELCRFIADGGGSWTKCMGLLAKLEDTNPESTRILIANYLGACLKSAKNDQAAVMFIGKLDAFSIPYTGTDGVAPLLVSIGRAILSE